MDWLLKAALPNKSRNFSSLKKTSLCNVCRNICNLFSQQRWCFLTPLPGVESQCHFAVTQETVQGVLTVLGPTGTKQGLGLHSFWDASFTINRKLYMKQHKNLIISKLTDKKDIRKKAYQKAVEISKVFINSFLFHPFCSFRKQRWQMPSKPASAQVCSRTAVVFTLQSAFHMNCFRNAHLPLEISTFLWKRYLRTLDQPSKAPLDIFRLQILEQTALIQA